MIRIAAIILLAVGAFSKLSAQQFAADKMDTILYGAAYYPEYMPYDRLDKDVELMQKAGLTVVRVGESTWSSWEPADGDFRLILLRVRQAVETSVPLAWSSPDAQSTK